MHYHFPSYCTLLNVQNQKHQADSDRKAKQLKEILQKTAVFQNVLPNISGNIYEITCYEN
jgi:hypothetical protein